MAPEPMLVVGVLGLVINVICMVLLYGGANESLNVKGAYLEVVVDAAGGVGVIVAGVLVVLTGTAILLGREVLAVLGQHIPENMDIQVVGATPV